MAKKCLECNEVFQGRSDKKFCSDMCRNAFNNKVKSNDVNLVRNINNALRKNRRILQELNPTGKSKASRSKLLEKGFDFNYFTNIYTTQKGARYFFCYDYGYLSIENDYFILVLRQEKDLKTE